MAEFKKWISYLYEKTEEDPGRNAGYVRVEVRQGQCHLMVGVKCPEGQGDGRLQLGLYQRIEETQKQISLGQMVIWQGRGQWEQVGREDDLFGSGLSLWDSVGLWVSDKEGTRKYETFWEPQEPRGPEAVLVVKQQEAIGEPEVKMEKQEQNEPALWECLCRYYPKAAPHLQKQGIELLKIRPADIRYLPRRLWYYTNNSFLLHGYYHHNYLLLGRMHGEEGHRYCLGVPGKQEERERFFARMFGFGQFQPLQGSKGYWYAQIYL